VRIDRIDLKNFLSHSESSVNFKGRINVLIGHNGAGKSSIIDGIVFALFRESSRGNANKNLVRMGNRSASVRLTLANGNQIIIERHLPDSGSDLLIVGSVPRARGAEKVTEEVQKIINIDEEVLLSTLIVRQGEIESIFEDLTNVLKKVMKIENLEKLTEASGPIYFKMKEIQGKLEQIQTFEKEYTDTSRKLDDLIREKSKIEEELEELRKSEETLNGQLQEAQRSLDDAQRKRDEYLLLVSRRNQLTRDKKEVEDRLSQLAGAEEKKSAIEERIRELEKYEEARGLLDQLREVEKDIVRIGQSLEKAMKERDAIKDKLRRKEELYPDYLSYVANKEELESIEEKEREYNGLKATYKNIQEEISRIDKALSSLKVIDTSKIEDEIRKVEDEISELNSRKGKLTAQLDEAKKILSGLEQVKGGQCPVCRRQLDESHRLSLIQEAKSVIKSSKEELDNVSRRLSELAKRKEDLRRQLSNANQNNSRYNTLAEKKTELEKQLADVQSRLEELKKVHEEYVKLKDILNKLEPAYKEYLTLSKVNEEDLKEKEEEICKLNRQMEEKQTKKNEIMNKLTEMDLESIEEKLRELEELKKRLNDVLQKLGERSSLEMRLNDIQKSLEEIGKKIAELNFSEEEYQEAKRKVEELRNKLLDTSNKIAEYNGRLNQIRKDIEEKEKRLKELEALIDQKPRLEKALKKLAKLREDLGEKGLQSYIISAVKSKIENNLNEITSMFNLAFTRVSLEFNTSTRGQKIKASLSAYDNYGREYAVDMLSGGEKISIALALRLAIAKSLMDSLGFIILDEPTVHLDEERRKELMNVIRGALDVVPQIIVVTHDDEILEIGDYIIRVEKRGSESKVTEEVPGND
jgi:exonuclease SbcC